MIQLLVSNDRLSQFQSHDTLTNKTTDNLKSHHLLSFVSSASCHRQPSNWQTPGEFCPTVSHSSVQYLVISNGRVLIQFSSPLSKKYRLTVTTDVKSARALVQQSFILPREQQIIINLNLALNSHS
jgi:hypothetical protein